MTEESEGTREERFWADLTLALLGSAPGVTAATEAGLLAALLTMEPALRGLGGLEGIEESWRKLVEAAAVVERLPLSTGGWPKERREAVRGELLAADRALVYWYGKASRVLELLDARGWRYNAKDGTIQVTGAWNRPLTLYAATVGALYDELRPGYIAETGDRRRNPRALRDRIAERLGTQPSEFRDPRTGRKLHRAIQNHTKNAGP